MRAVHICLSVALLIVLIIGATHAATTAWLSTSAAGTPISDDIITVAPGASVQLYCFMQSDQIGNTFEFMVGYDKSDAFTHGVGKDTNNGANKKLTLVSSKADILGSLPATFNVFTLSGYADSGVVLDASGHEAYNGGLGGRPYGFVVRAARTSNAVLPQTLCFSFTLRNNMTTAGEYQYVVLSNDSGGRSYSSAWKHGVDLGEDAYTLKVVTGSATLKDTVGTSGKGLLDDIMGNAVDKYDWVLWGDVIPKDASSFYLNDGSGVSVLVEAPGHGLADVDYVSVKGTLDLSGSEPKLTNVHVTKYR